MCDDDQNYYHGRDRSLLLLALLGDGMETLESF